MRTNQDVGTPTRTRSGHVGRAVSLALAISLILGTSVAISAAGAAPAVADTPCPCSLWSDSTTPAVVDSGDANAVELGVQFSASSAGYISGVRFYKASANTGIHIGSLWSATGTLLAQATFSNETASGWQQVTFSQPVAVAANTTYVAGYHTDTGHYSADSGYFSGGPYTNGALTALSSASSPNGLFAYSPTPTFPTGTFGADNYWVDVVYASTPPPPPPSASSLWGPNVTPTVIDSGDPAATELGVQFSSASAGYISGVRFYKASANTGTHIGSLWTATGTLLAQATFSNETVSGWQQVTFSQPVAIAANTTYVAGYHTDTGHYSFDQGYFDNNTYLDPPLSASGGNPASPNGVFTYSPTPTFPSSTFNASNYWVDVVFAPAPVPVSLTVGVPQSQVPKGVAVQLSATEGFSDGSSKDVTSQVAWTSSNPGVASVSAAGILSTVSQGSASVTAALAGLSGSTTVTVVAPIAFMIIDPPIALMRTGQSLQLAVTAWLSNGSRLAVTNLATWSLPVSGSATIKISNHGVVSVSGPGIGIVSASVGRATTYGLVLALR